MLHELSHKQCLERKINAPVFEPEYEEVFEDEQVEHNGIILTQKVAKRRRVDEKFEDYRVSDFNLHNMIAIGADKGLKEITPQPSIEQFEQEMNNYANNVNSIENE